MICCCCGCPRLALREILWEELITEWRIASHEVAYINRQQGLSCTECLANLRSMALAAAVMRWVGYDGLFKHYVKEESARKLDVLEINEAGGLSPFLAELPNRVLRSYPDIDMTALPYGDDSFDLVLHSDTLEHVRHPVRALSECRRVLKPGGGCAFTVPLVVDRLTLSREGMPPSYHGASDTRSGDYQVCTEYGADAWKHVVQAGFPECRIVSFEYPAAQALVGVK